jgi:hypothetical protein
LAEVEARSGNHTIYLRLGTYAASDAPGGAGFVVTLGGGKSLTLDGGWFPLQGQPCALRYPQAQLTLLDGGGDRRVMTLVDTGGGGFTVRNLTFANGWVADAAGTGAAGLQIDAGNSARVLVEQNIFRDHRGVVGAALRAGKVAGTFVLRNNLFHDNFATSNAPALYLSLFEAGSGVIAGNTFARNEVGGTMAATSRTFTLNGPVGALVVNNLLWDNVAPTAQPVDFPARLVDTVVHNAIQKPGGVLGPESVGNLSVDPLLTQDFRLGEGSPLRNAGYDAGPEVLGAADLDGKARRLGRATDIGAYEVPELFGDGFE